jgi:hypothetical protein
MLQQSPVSVPHPVVVAVEVEAVRYYEGLLKNSWTRLIAPGTLWKCCDGLFFEVSPLASDALVTTLHPLLENVQQTVDHFKISCLVAPFLWLEKPRNLMGRDLDCMADDLMGFHRRLVSQSVS